MEFAFEDYIWVNECDLEEMIERHLQHNVTLEDAFIEVSKGWDDCDYYNSDKIKEDVIAELERRIKESEEK